METKPENKIPDWLKNLQENSWELELLVSGGAIFSLIQLSDLYIDWISTIRITSSLPGAGIVLIIGMLGIKILTIGFILHLILRAFWLGLVCVNYVYPNGINSPKIKQQKPFKPKDIEGDLKDQIMRVDHLCGTIMFTSIVSAVAITGIIVLFCIVLFFILQFESNWNTPFFEYFSFILLIYFGLYVLDLIFMGILRKIPFLSYLFYPIFRLYDILSFRILYQRPLSLFSSNVNKFKFFIRAVAFTCLSLVATYLAVYRTMHWPNAFDSREFKWQLSENEHINYSSYRDQLKENDRKLFTIQSKLIQSNYLDVFILYQRGVDETIGASNKIDSLQFYSNIIGINIDDSSYSNIEWYTNWNQEITNLGISAMIDIRHLSNGKHKLQLYTKFSSQAEYEKANKEESFLQESTILFWKDVN